MGKPQTRRSVSVQGITYQRMKNYAVQTGRSVSGITEEIVNARLDELGVRTFTPEEAEALRPKNTGEGALKHPDKRANEAQPKKPKPKPKAKPAPVEPAADHVLEARHEEDVPPREARPAKEPTLAPAPPKEPPRGGGVHSF